MKEESAFNSFEYFLEWSRKLQFTDGFNELYKLVLDAVCKQTAYNNAWIFISDPELKDEVYLVSMQGDKSAELLENFPRFNLNSDPMLVEIRDSMNPVIVEDARTDPRTNKEIVSALGNVTIINIPIILTGELVGLIGAGSFGEEGVINPSSEDLDVFLLLSNYVAPVIVRILEKQKRDQHQKALEKAKQIAEQASAVKSEFIQNVSHELKTPLHAIFGFVQLLEMEKSDFNENQNQYVSEIKVACSNLIGLVDDVLDLGKSESGELVLKRGKVELQALLSECIEKVEPQAKTNGIKINNSLKDAEPIYIFTDKKRLAQVLDNLIENAVSYNKPDGHVNITTNITNYNQVQIVVEDSGVGISEEKQDMLFSPFSRVALNNQKIGSGMGLVMSKKIVELMGSELSFKSEAGVGSSFWFELEKMPD